MLGEVEPAGEQLSKVAEDGHGVRADAEGDALLGCLIPGGLHHQYDLHEPS